jgi:hypothetical protein
MKYSNRDCRIKSGWLKKNDWFGFWFLDGLSNDLNGIGIF